MSAREIQGQKAIALEMMVQQAAHANADVSASPLPGDTICSTKSRRDCTLESNGGRWVVRTCRYIIASRNPG